MAQYIAPTLDVNLDPNGLVIDLNSLYAWLARLHDTRQAQGLRYSLVTVLLLVVLAKLAGQDRLAGIAEWVRHREGQLATALHLKKPRTPCLNTYRNLLGKIIDVQEFEQVLHDFFAAQPGAGTSVQIALDGKTLRGTIPAGQTKGVHLLAAYAPQEGWVLMEVEVAGKQNEIPAAPRVLQCLDLRGKVVTADALLTQRNLSLQIVESGGDYLWTVKENQETLYQDVERLFAPEPVVKGFSPASHDDFRTFTTFDKGHGRHEWRTITVSSALKDYLDWPYAAQVFKLEQRFVRVTDGKTLYEVSYGITSLTQVEASPVRLLALKRGHWGIENGLHYRRDETMREDWYHLTKGHTAHAMALLNNLVLGLILRQGQRNVPQARRNFDAHLEAALQLVLGRPPEN
jgi:predicted transposase YbfD/YdcC